MHCARGGLKLCDALLAAALFAKLPSSGYKSFKLGTGPAHTGRRGLLTSHKHSVASSAPLTRSRGVVARKYAPEHTDVWPPVRIDFRTTDTARVVAAGRLG